MRPNATPAAVACTALLMYGCATNQPVIQLDTVGADAWTFAPQISGRVLSGRCDDVFLRSPTGQIRAARYEQHFTVSMPLASGDNSIQAICKIGAREVASSDIQQWRVLLPDHPKAWIRTSVSDTTIVFDARRTERAGGSAVPISRYEWFAAPNNPAPLKLANGDSLSSSHSVRGQRIELATPAREGDYYVRLRATDALERGDESTGVFRVTGRSARTVDLQLEHPDWVNRAVVYGAAPYNFTPQDFVGIRARLPAIARLGATVLWLSPITVAASDDFGYAVVDHFVVRPDFGGADSLRKLIREAHALGIRVIVDFVPNHLSDRHAYHIHSTQLGTRSPYYDWFDRDESGEVTQYFDWSHLKNLNYDNVEVQNYMIEACSRFVRNFDVDGFRVDASWAIARRAPEFWPRLRAELKRIDPDIFLLAEASVRESDQVSLGSTRRTTGHRGSVNGLGPMSSMKGVRI